MGAHCQTFCRDREKHLRMFLHNLHFLLAKQQMDYAIFIVQQAANQTFNRGKLLNVGFREALRLYDWQCFVFHDVDLLPEDDRNLYSCPQQPRHMSVAVDKFHYRSFAPPPDPGPFNGQHPKLPFLLFLKIALCPNIRWCHSNDAGTVRADQWVLQRLLGLGRRGRRHFETVGTVDRAHQSVNPIRPFGQGSLTPATPSADTRRTLGATK